MNKQEKINKILNYINLKWESGATGPDTYDCQGLVVDVQKNIYNKIMPDVKVNSEKLISIVRAISKNKIWDRFQKINTPEDGCIVKMFTAEEPNHIGVYIDIDNGGVLHSLRKSGVVWDNMFIIKKTYAQIEFWRFLE